MQRTKGGAPENIVNSKNVKIVKNVKNIDNSKTALAGRNDVKRYSIHIVVCGVLLIFVGVLMSTFGFYLSKSRDLNKTLATYSNLILLAHFNETENVNDTAANLTADTQDLLVSDQWNVIVYNFTTSNMSAKLERTNKSSDVRLNNNDHNTTSSMSAKSSDVRLNDTDYNYINLLHDGDDDDDGGDGFNGNGLVNQQHSISLTFMSYIGPCLMGIGCIVIVIYYVVMFESRDDSQSRKLLNLLNKTISTDTDKLETQQPGDSNQQLQESLIKTDVGHRSVKSDKKMTKNYFVICSTTPTNLTTTSAAESTKEGVVRNGLARALTTFTAPYLKIQPLIHSSKRFNLELSFIDD